MGGRGGIPHWQTKHDLLKALFECDRSVDFVAAIVKTSEQEVARLADTMRHWDENMPRPPGKRFLSEVLKMLKVDMAVDAFISCTPEAFSEQLKDEDDKEAARQFFAGRSGDASDGHAGKTGAAARPSDARTWMSRESYVIRVGAHPMSQAMLQASSDRLGVNHSHYYMSPQAPRLWKDLVRSEKYQTFQHCQSTLRRLTRTKEWLAELKEKPVTCAAMLGGGGAPEKDAIIVSSLLESNAPTEQKIDYAIVDISVYMLIESVSYLENQFVQEVADSKIAFKALCYDMLDLDYCQEHLERNGRRLFAITGGTIGNVSEDRLFHSMKRVARAGDLLIISADTFTKESIAEVQPELRRKYDHPQMRRFLAPIVRTLLDDNQQPETLDHALGRIRTEVRQGDERESDLRDAISVVLTLNVGGRDVTLVTSSRYTAEGLQSFAAGKGWELLAQASEPDTSRFTQFLFRRVQRPR